MARSKKKTPIAGIAGNSEKFDKRLLNRRLRRCDKKLLRNINEDIAMSLIFPVKNEILDKWSMAKDGKIYYKKSNKYYNKIIRK